MKPNTLSTTAVFGLLTSNQVDCFCTTPTDMGAFEKLVNDAEVCHG